MCSSNIFISLFTAFSFLLSCVSAAQNPQLAQHDSSALVLEGLVTPEKEIDLAAPSEGLVLEVLVKEGTSVAAGTPIARLTNEEEEIQVRQAELVSRQLDEDLNSTKRLYEEKAASRDDMNRATLSAQRAASERDLLQIRLRQRTILAPVSGYVLRLLKDPGESVQRLEKVAEIVSLDRKLIIAYADASLFGKIKPGASTSVVSDRGGEILLGVVELVDPILDAGGRVYRIKILVEDPRNILSVGTRVPVHLESQ